MQNNCILLYCKALARKPWIVDDFIDLITSISRKRTLQNILSLRDRSIPICIPDVDS